MAALTPLLRYATFAAETVGEFEGTMDESEEGDLGFRSRAAKRGEVVIHHRGRLATTLRGTAAEIFLQELDGASFAEAQQLMARVTGNYRRGNERLAKKHPRNR
jgi:hypothetical protein